MLFVCRCVELSSITPVESAFVFTVFTDKSSGENVVDGPPDAVASVGRAAVKLIGPL